MKPFYTSGCSPNVITITLLDQYRNSFLDWRFKEVAYAEEMLSVELQRALGPAQMMTNLLHEGLRIPLESSQIVAAHDRSQTAALVAS